MVTAGSTPNAELNAVGVERIQHAELLGNLERGIMLQHHATAANLYGRRFTRDLPYQDLGGVASERDRVVVLSNPVPYVSEPLGGLSQLYSLTQGLPRCRPSADHRLV